MVDESKISEIKKRAADKWASLGFLDGIKGPITNENFFDLYICEASHLLNESAPKPNDELDK